MAMEKIAVPSSGRAGRARSLEQLIRLHERADVSWYVPAEEASAYEKALPWWMNVRPLTDCHTVDVARNAIHSDYAGDRVVVMEDDVPWYVGSREVFEPSLHPGSPPSSPRLNVLEVAALGWAAARRHDLSVWGIYPVAYSGLALKPRYGVGSLFLVGHTVGLDLRGDFQPRLRLPIKEDYELTALAIEAEGAVVRLDCICPYSVSGKGAGGTNQYRNPQQEAEAADALLRRWPAMFEPKPGLREGLAQVKMVGPNVWHPVGREAGWRPYEKGA